jgi:hypothetical protein
MLLDKRKIKKLNKILIAKDHAKIVIDSEKYGKQYALIDKEDIDKIKNYTWCLMAVKLKDETVLYVQSNKKLLHREIMNNPIGMQIDHINHNPLDNRKSNLRVCTSKENCQARRYDYRLTLYFNNYHQHYVARYQAKDKMYERASKNKDLAISNLKKLLKENNIVISEVEDET